MRTHQPPTIEHYIGILTMRGSPCVVILLLCIILHDADAWFPSTVPSVIQQRRPRPIYSSTPFEADLYDNPFADDAPSSSSLSVPPDTRLVLGLNKYTHDTSLCAADARTGRILFALSKERIGRRRKHDAGNVAALVETCLESLDVSMENIQSVVVNNHHHRVLPLEQNLRHLEWEAGLGINNGGGEDGYTDPENLFPDIPQHEISHHLAHAYSTAAQAPFDVGMCVVMDGMGETFRTMQQAIVANDTTYTSDLSFGLDSFQCVPSDIATRAATNSIFDWREAESVYLFNKTDDRLDLKPVFKRFTPEHSPPTLYNHGFENMESMGALYSRASSHIFGDWNACGKVMGLAPWGNTEWMPENVDGGVEGRAIRPQQIEHPIMEGRLYSEQKSSMFRFNRSVLEGEPLIARNDPDLFTEDGTVAKKRYDFDDGFDDESGHELPRIPSQVALEAIAVAHRVQTDLETVAMDFVQHFKNTTGSTHLCLAGGVALNSVLNGRLARELGFQDTFVSPYPGDDGIAVGCCAFGLWSNSHLDNRPADGGDNGFAPVWRRPISPYLGPDPSEQEIKDAVESGKKWLDIEVIRDDDARVALMVEELEAGAVIAWYRSRSEMGPRALGHRSILADPRKKGLVRFINGEVKSRESFRPFAPSVLAEEAQNWFDLGNLPSGSDGNVSPYMSMTANVHADKQLEIPAVTHVDGSSRLQTVTRDAEPLYHKLISKFFARTGVPMVLNTSFNTLPSEPIVESPHDAIRSFFYSMNSVAVLVMGDYVIRRKEADLQRLLGEVTKEGYLKNEPGMPTRTGPCTFQTTAEVTMTEEDDDDTGAITKVCMPDRPSHGPNNEWFELLDELEAEILALCDGTVTLNEIMEQYSSGVELDDEKEKKEVTENLLQNIVHRIVRLYENTLIGW